jgi:hypothetical protein
MLLLTGLSQDAVASSTPVSGTVLANVDLTNVPIGTRAASMDNPGLPALPGLENTYWNIRSTNSAGTPFAQVESDAVVGKMLHFHVPSNYQATDGDATVGAVRAEQQPNIANIVAGDVRWIGFWFKVGAAEAASTTHPKWNIALQFANAVGAPSIALTAFGQESNPRGVALHGASLSRRRDLYRLHGINWTRWHRVELGLTRITYGVVSPGSAVRLYVDCGLVVNDTDWRADSGAAGLGGLIPSGASNAYLKFGVYGGKTPMPWPRDHYFADFKVGTTRSSVVPRTATDKRPSRSRCRRCHTRAACRVGR